MDMNLLSLRRLLTLGVSGVLLAVMLWPLAGSPGYGQEYDPFKPPAGGEAPDNTENVIASVEFVDTPITNIFRMISDLTGWSIIMSPELSRQPPKINLWIKNLTPGEVLDELSHLAGLVIRREGRTVNVMTFREYADLFGLEQKVLPLQNAKAGAVADVLKGFVAKNEAAVVQADDIGNAVVLLVPGSLMDSLEKLVRALDTKADTVEVVSLEHLEADLLAPALEAFLTETPKGEPSKALGRYLVQFMVERKLNVIVLRGAREDVAAAKALIRRLDVQPDIRVVSYQLKFTNAKEVYATLEEIATTDDPREARANYGLSKRLSIALSEQNNCIVVEGTPKDHRRLAELIGAIDQPLPPGSGGMRVYRLENASAEEVAEVLQSLIKGQRTDLAKQRRSVSVETRQGIQRVGPRRTDREERGRTSRAANTGAELVQPASGDMELAQITAAPEINAVIIKASAMEHEEFAAIIEDLDKPRDQTLLEVMLVTVTRDDTFDLGVELGGARLGQGGAQQIGFTTFGIGAIDSATGAIRLSQRPPFGLNYALFRADEYSLIINALRTAGDVRITSAPKILVEDNAEAVISQLSQEPYEVVSQGEETTLTSFGGYVQAGTILTVIPHISQGDWLRLQYEIIQSSFGTRTAEQLAANLPPPKQENQAGGTVRIPAEHMVVLGGLVGTREDAVVNEVPLLADIPLLGELFRSRSNTNSNETLFIFIRPIILRDPAFRDLLSISDEEVQRAKLREEKTPQNPLKWLVPEAVDRAVEPQDDSAKE